METTPPPAPAGPQFLRGEQVYKITGLSRTTVWRMASAGDFPRPVALSPRTRAWLASDVHRWLDARIAAAQNRSAA